MASIFKAFHDHKEFKKNASDLSEDISSKGQRLSENSTLSSIFEHIVILEE